MKRTRIQLADIAAFDNLTLAVWKAARGKRHRPDVIHFTNHYSENLQRLADDILFWCESRDAAKTMLRDLGGWLAVNRLLTIKPNPQINRSQRGVSYCGYRVLPDKVLLSRRKRQRYQQLRLAVEQAWLNGEISAEALQQAYQSIHAITLHADSLAWRKQNLQLYPPTAI